MTYAVGIPLLVAIVAALVWWHEGGRYLAARIVHAKTSLHWWGVGLDGDRGKRAIGALGGLVASYLACVALAFALAMLRGSDRGPVRIFVGEVRLGYDAVDKLAPGDVILALDGEPLYADSGPSIVERVNAKHGAPIAITFDRDGAQRDVTVQPKQGTDAMGRTVWLLGIRPEPMRMRTSDTGAAMGFALRYPFEQLPRMIADFDDALDRHERADPGGPVRIVDAYQRAGSEYSRLHAITTVAIAMLFVLAILDAVRLVPRYAERT